jgi:hypothetical protein
MVEKALSPADGCDLFGVGGQFSFRQASDAASMMASYFSKTVFE